MAQKIGLIGAGNMGAGIVARFTQAGHTVLVSGSDPEKARVTAQHSAVLPGSATVVEESEALAADVVVLALWYPATIEFAKSHTDALAGKIVIDIAIPLDASFTRLAIPGDTSAAEELAKVLPESHVVKAMNTIPASILMAAQIDGLTVDAYVAGDSQSAKDTVLSLLEGSGLRGIDAGALDNARLLERLTAFGIELGQRHDLGFNFSWKFLPTRDLATKGN